MRNNGLTLSANPSKFSALKNLQIEMETRIYAQFASQRWMVCRPAFLSDTIAISMTLETEMAHRDAMSVLYLADVISWALKATLCSSIPLAYRGALAVGDYELDQNFLIGEAIDEAAEAHERAHGAIIFLTPGARDHVAAWLADQPDNTHLVKYDVPLKGGDAFNTYAVSPLEQSPNKDEDERWTRALLQTFDNPSMDVAIKRQNTARFMQACAAWKARRRSHAAAEPFQVIERGGRR